MWNSKRKEIKTRTQIEGIKQEAVQRHWTGCDVPLQNHVVKQGGLGVNCLQAMCSKGVGLCSPKIFSHLELENMTDPLPTSTGNHERAGLPAVLNHWSATLLRDVAQQRKSAWRRQCVVCSEESVSRFWSTTRSNIRLLLFWGGGGGRGGEEEGRRRSTEIHLLGFWKRTKNKQNKE